MRVYAQFYTYLPLDIIQCVYYRAVGLINSLLINSLDAPILRARLIVTLLIFSLFSIISYNFVHREYSFICVISRYGPRYLSIIRLLHNQYKFLLNQIRLAKNSLAIII